MAGLNKVQIIGNLGRDPELRFTQSGTPVASLNIATTRTFTNRNDERIDETEWHRVTVWGPQAEHCNKYLSKGRQVYVEGRLQTRKYQDKDGVDRYSTDIIAESVQFLGQRPGGPDRGEEQHEPQAAGRGQKRGQQQSQRGGQHDGAQQREAGGGFHQNYVPDPSDDDIPF